MASFLRKLRAAVPSVPDDGDDYSYEYSIAMEYTGPPVAYSIPEAAPFKIGQIPIAAVAPSAADEFSAPIIQPIVKTNRKSNTKLELRTDSVPSSNSESITVEISRLGTTESSSSHSLPSESSNIVNNTGSLVTAENADNFRGNQSQRLLTSGSGQSSGVPDDDKQDGGFQSEMNPTNSDTTESNSSSRSDSSDIFYSKEDDSNNDSPRHVKRPSIVTFRYPESNDMVVNLELEFDNSSQAASSPVRPRAERNGKQGTCYRCQKGNRFTEKEICLVCGAKYCRNCVLRQMGSMPEGRKCVTCIGCRIDENNRRILGKCSRMLKHMLSDLEVKKIMHAEMLCEANQIPAERVVVNGEPLDQEQLMFLLTCPNPPKKLKPGFYWYDKASGFWGKENQGPRQIISAQLDVGDHLKKNASNGNTNVYINGREVTKDEYWMLKVAGVPCEGRPNFWVSADGSYQEEGQKNVKGRIWHKTRAKLACAILSLPVPSNSVSPGEEGGGATRVLKENLEQKMLQKFLLVGSSKSGTSTIFKQAKVLYNVPFSESEIQNMKLVIQSNLYTYLGILLEGRESFEEESLLERRKRQLVDESTSAAGNAGEITDTTIYSIGPRLKAFSDWLLQYMVSGNLDAIFPAASREYAPLVEELWKDPAIQATYNRRNELEMLPRGASYFLDRAVEISNVDYEPSQMDMMYAEGITLSNSLTSMEFSFPDPDVENPLDPDYPRDPSLRYQLVRVHPKSLGENCKWVEIFEDINLVSFCVALTDYDECTIDINGVSTNKMMAAKHLFENLITHPTFKNKKFLLILNKFDLLEEKIEVVPLTRCEWFGDFHPFISNNHNRASNQNNNPPLAQRAFQYIAVKFKRLFKSLTEQKLFVSLVTGLEADTVDEALKYAREIMAWEKWEPSFINEKSEITSTSFEEVSSS